MKLDRLWIASFKNLRDFSIDFDESSLMTVLIGRNGSGKSNIVETLVQIFRNLDLGDRPPFQYTVKYLCKGHTISIEADTDERMRRPTVSVDGKSISLTELVRRRDDLLPSHVFAYYSGPSGRLETHFNRHQRRFYEALLRGNSKPLRPLFYARPIHSLFVLLSYYSFDDYVGRTFLKDHFDILGLEPVLFVLRKPDWGKRSQPGGDSRFWYARGVVSDFLDKLYRHSLAPIYVTERFYPAFNKQSVSEDRIYLFIQDESRLIPFPRSPIV